MEKAHLTLYTVIGSPQHILTGIQSLFAPVIQSVDTEADQIRVTLQDDSLLVFHLSHVREKAGFIEMHIEGWPIISPAATSNPALKENVLRQIRCFNCVVGIVFETDDNNDRTRYLINTLFDLAHQVKGYLLYPNMHLYDGEGKLVFSREGESELTEFTPVAHADLLDGGIVHGTPLYLQLDNRSQQGGSLGRYSTQYLNISERIYRYFVKEKSNLLNNPFNTKLFL